MSGQPQVTEVIVYLVWQIESFNGKRAETPKKTNNFPSARPSPYNGFDAYWLCLAGHVPRSRFR